MNLCIIPARGGSKRIPRKNIKNFLGKPLIAYSINAAKQSGVFDEVVVSTDDEEIAEVARSHGASVPFLRAPDLSDDHAITKDVVLDVIKWFKTEKYAVENVCCLYATAPFCRSEDLKKSLNVLNESSSQYCFSVTSFPFPIQRALYITKEGNTGMFYPSEESTRSQDLEDAFHDAGQFYWGTSVAWESSSSIFSSSSVPYILPRFLVQDIDTLEDWTRAEIMMQILLQREILT